MRGPTIVTTSEIRICCVCGGPAIAGTGVAESRWWCAKHIDVGLANTAVDLVFVRFDARSEEEQRELEEEPA